MLKYHPNYILELCVCSGKLIHRFMLVHRQQVWDPHDKLDPDHIKVNGSSLTSKDFRSETKIRCYGIPLNNPFVSPSFILVDERENCFFLFLFLSILCSCFFILSSSVLSFLFLPLFLFCSLSPFLLFFSFFLVCFFKPNEQLHCENWVTP